MIIILNLAIVFLLVLFFSWALLLPLKKGNLTIDLESPYYFLVMVIPETILAGLLILAGRPELVLGLVLGTNLVSFLLLPGLTAVLQGPVKVAFHHLRRDFWMGFLLASLPLLLLLDFTLSAVEGLVLLAFAAVWLVWRYVAYFGKKFSSWSDALTHYYHKINRQGGLLALAALISLLIFLILLKFLFSSFGDRIGWQRGYWLALPVCLPEILLILSKSRKKKLILFDGILAPLIFNATFLLGLTGWLQPFSLQALSSYLWMTIFFLAAFLLFYFLAWSKRQIDRWEGIVFLLFLVFLAVVIYL